MNDPIDRPHRRDIVIPLAKLFVAGGVAAAAWPFIAQMRPGRDDEQSLTKVDIRGVAPGETRTVAWQGQPVILWRRTEAEIRAAQNVDMGSLIDPYARNDMLPPKAPASDANRTLQGRDEWLVVGGRCTHLGCMLIETSKISGLQGEESGVWLFCPCHAARFDFSGRVLGGPALTNLPVPPYRIEGDSIVLGQA